MDLSTRFRPRGPSQYTPDHDHFLASKRKIPIAHLGEQKTKTICEFNDDYWHKYNSRQAILNSKLEIKNIPARLPANFDERVYCLSCESTRKLIEEISESLTYGTKRVPWLHVQAPGWNLPASEGENNNETLSCDTSIEDSLDQSSSLAAKNSRKIVPPQKENNNNTINPLKRHNSTTTSRQARSSSSSSKSSIRSSSDILSKIKNERILPAIDKSRIRKKELENILKPDDDDEMLMRKIQAKIRRKNRNKELQLRRRQTLGELNVNKSVINKAPHSFQSGGENINCKQNIINTSLHSSSMISSSGDSAIFEQKNRSNVIEKLENESKENLEPSEHSKRYSTRFDKEQTRVLKEWYEANRDKPYASDEIINKLAERINLEPRSVRKWMSNKRTRLLETRTFRKKY